MSEELPDELNKLEIAPGELHELGLAPLKLIDSTELPLILNPFYEDDKKLEEVTAGHSPQSSVTQRIRKSELKCRRCRLRRRSESVLDEYKASAIAATNTAVATCSTHFTPGVQRQPLKKTSSSTGMSRKSLIREPVLCALQNCFHAQNVRRKLQTTVSGDGENAAVKQPSLANTATDLWSVATSLVVDFQKSLEQDLGDLRGTKNFTTMQLHDTVNKNSSIRTGNDGSVGGGSDALSNSIMQRNSSSPEHSALARASTSCSQQAGNGAANAASNCDDVTIDELASYFETLVHIPKKMSTMAEMMYI